MSNSYFQFKQFRIEQSACAMKVSTDACIQGAWTPIPAAIKNVLDIGCGTGLLSLMLAQRNETILIDAIEIDENAAKQAAANFKNSPWDDRLTLVHADAKSYSFPRKYDLIICNPPFFKNSLLGDNEKRNFARHNIHFSFEDLINTIDDNLNDEGYASILLPAKEHEQWAKLVKDNFYFIHKLLNVYPSRHKPCNRIISIINKKPSLTATINESLQIRSETTAYSETFKHLLSSFYLTP